MILPQKGTHWHLNFFARDEIERDPLMTRPTRNRDLRIIQELAQSVCTNVQGPRPAV